MASQIDPENINTEYPVPRTNNNSQVFRDTFSTIKTSLETARDEITELQNRGILAGENITITPSLADPAKLIISSAGGGGNMSVYISDTPPVEPNEGDLWFNSTSGEMFIYYVDQDSSQWVGLTTSKVSQLENDLDFISVGGNISSLNNDAGYITESIPSLISFDLATQSIKITGYSLGIDNQGENNIALGVNSLVNNTTGENNIGLGHNTLSVVSAGSNNIGIGNQAGSSITSGSNNTIIGSLPGTSNLNSTVLIGAGSTERIRVDDTGIFVNGEPLKFDLRYNVNNITGTAYTFVNTDPGRLLLFSNAALLPLTLPPDNDVTIPIGSFIDVIQMGAGQIQFQGGLGVTVSGTPGLKTRTQYSGASVIKVAANRWVIIGDLAE